MEFTKKNIFLIIITITTSLLVGIGIALGINQELFGFRTNSGYSQELILSYDKGDYGAGYKVTNTSGKDYFIPTKTKAEFDSFKNNIPAGVHALSMKDLGLGLQSNKRDSVFVL